MGVGAVIHCCVGDSASRIGAWGVTSTLRPAFYLPRCHYSTPFERQAQGVFAIKWGCACRDRVARHGRGVGGCRAPGIRRGQRLVPLHAIPRRWAGKPWALAPWGLRRSYALRGMRQGLLSAVGVRCSCGPLRGLQGPLFLCWNQNEFYLELT